MKKLAVGLTSAPFSGPPADTATSAKTDIEDEEVSNKTGFGQFETNLPLTIDFSKLKEVDMNNEIKKLEAALSGIGYNIKLASVGDPDSVQKQNAPDGTNFFTSEKCIKDKIYCIWLKVSPGHLEFYEYLMAPAIIGKCVSGFSSGLSNDDEAELSITYIAPYLNTLRWEKDLFNLINPVNKSDLKIGLTITLSQDYRYITEYESYINNIAEFIIRGGHTDKLNAASTSSGVAPTKNKSSPASKAPPTAITFQKGTNLQDDDWSYTVNGQYEVRVRKNDGTKNIVLTPAYKNWNDFAKKLNKMNAEQSQAPAATPAPAPTPAAPTPIPSTSTSGSVTELLNGQKVVTVGASGMAGGDIIMLDVASLNTGKPKFYIKDGKTRNVAELGANDGRVRGAISRADSRRLAASLKAQGVSEQKISAFLELMKLERRQNRIPFGRAKREDKMETERNNMINSADDATVEKSARDLRISRLEKKGIL